MATPVRIDFMRLFKKENEVTISRYLDEKLIQFLHAHSRDEALKSLVNLLDKEKKLHDKETFFQAILSREKLVSTGIGLSVAIPHAKLPNYDDFFIAVGLHKGEGIDWNSLDGSMVKIIFMIGGPENKQTDYLKILSLLTSAIKDEKRRKSLLKAKTPQEVLQIFKGV